jgi:transposase InsO family protein
VTTQADADGVAVIPDLVQRDFTTDCPGTTLVGDITHIHTWHGFIYQSTAIDCSAKNIVGWSVADHVRTSLAGNALRCGAMTLIAPGATPH